MQPWIIYSPRNHAKNIQAFMMRYAYATVLSDERPLMHNHTFCYIFVHAQHPSRYSIYDHRIFIFHSSTLASHQLFLGARSISAINRS